MTFSLIDDPLRQIEAIDRERLSARRKPLVNVQFALQRSDMPFDEGLFFQTIFDIDPRQAQLPFEIADLRAIGLDTRTECGVFVLQRLGAPWLRGATKQIRWKNDLVPAVQLRLDGDFMCFHRELREVGLRPVAGRVAGGRAADAAGDLALSAGWTQSQVQGQNSHAKHHGRGRMTRGPANGSVADTSNHLFQARRQWNVARTVESPLKFPLKTPMFLLPLPPPLLLDGA